MILYLFLFSAFVLQNVWQDIHSGLADRADRCVSFLDIVTEILIYGVHNFPITEEYIFTGKQW